MASRVTKPLPLPLQGPTAKEKKYDRQLRLWGANGQQALEKANVLLINSGPGVVGIETLKNLILPGIGKFTIVDDSVVTERDLGVNFFLTEESLGKSRAQESCRFLEELNPGVNGTACEKSSDAVSWDRCFISRYSIILMVSPVRPLIALSRVSDLADQLEIPLFYIHSVGFYSQFSVQLPDEFPVIDTHPDPISTHDLRLLDPWPELLDFARIKTRNLESLTDHEHGHIPYPLLLLHYLDIWKAENGGRAPQSYAQKKEFKSLVQAGARTANAEGGEENFDEAAAAVLKSLNEFQLPGHLSEILGDEKCQFMDPDAEKFWVLAYAIRHFHKNSDYLPLPGSLPDMKAQSDDYIQLQNIYKTKARKDVLEVIERVRGIEKDLETKSVIDEKEIEAFCKNAAFIKLIAGRRIPLPHWPGAGTYPKHKREWMRQELLSEDSSLLIFISFMAYDMALEVPGPLQNGEDAQTRLVRNMTKLTNTFFEFFTQGLKVIASEKEIEIDFDPEPSREKAFRINAELRRAQGAELHNISALTGGIIAQEVIKVLTEQYVPMNNTCVFDGIASRIGVFNL